MNIIKKLILVATLVATSLVQAVIPEMEVWSDGNGHYRYLLKDWHVDYADGRISIAQQKDIVWAAQQKQNEGVFVIAEDITDSGNINTRLKNAHLSDVPQTMQDAIAARRLQAMNTASAQIQDSQEYIDLNPFVCLVAACQKNKITCFNSECTQALYLYLRKLASREEVIEHLHTNSKEMTADFFTQIILYSLEDAGLSDHSFMSAARMLRSKLVNEKTIDKLKKWSSIKHGFVCEGQSHIEAIKSGLINLGYKKIKHIGKADIFDKSTTLVLKKSESHEFLAHTVALRNALDLKKEFTAIFAEQAAEKKLKAATAAGAPLIKSKL